MALSVSAQNSADYSSASSTTTTVQLTGVTAGDLICIWFKHEGSPTTYSCADSGATDDFSVATRTDHTNSDLSGGFFYLLSATVTGTVTYTVTTGAGKSWREIVAVRVGVDSGEVVTLSAQATGQGQGTSLNSDTISPPAGDVIVFGGYGNYSAQTTGSDQIDSVASDSQETATYTTAWWRVITAGFTAGDASATISSSADWICNIIAFESAASGGYTLTADGGTYTETGMAATLQYGRKLAAASVAYSLAGTAAGLAYGRKLVSAPVAYDLTGVAASLEYGRSLSAAGDAYSWLGQAATLTYNAGTADYILTAEGGAYTETGQDATLTRTAVLAIDSAAYALTGTAASLRRTWNLAAASGAYVETGQAAGLKRGYKLVAVVGAYTLSGSLASLIWSGAAAGGAGAVITMPLIISNGAEAALPISLAVSSGGGVSGLSVTMAIRDGSTLDSYLDFNDLTFKTSGWANQTEALTDQSGGYYAELLNVGGITNLPIANLIVEFSISGSLNEVAMGSVISAKSSILGASNALTLGKFLALKDA